TSPTGGDDGCAGATVNSFTPGWCLGGTARSGNANGHLNGPRGVAVTSNGLFVVDVVNNRISRYDAATGEFLGWHGAIATLPNGGADGCTTAGVGAMTPGWCLGGTAKASSELGTFDGPIDVTADAVYLYVSDA